MLYPKQFQSRRCKVFFVIQTRQLWLFCSYTYSYCSLKYKSSPALYGMKICHTSQISKPVCCFWQMSQQVWPESSNTQWVNCDLLTSSGLFPYWAETEQHYLSFGAITINFIHFCCKQLPSEPENEYESRESGGLENEKQWSWKTVSRAIKLRGTAVLCSNWIIGSWFHHWRQRVNTEIQLSAKPYI